VDQARAEQRAVAAAIKAGRDQLAAAKLQLQQFVDDLLKVGWIMLSGDVKSGLRVVVSQSPVFRRRRDAEERKLSDRVAARAAEIVAEVNSRLAVRSAMMQVREAVECPRDRALRESRMMFNR
jgi:hypothetical protein